MANSISAICAVKYSIWFVLEVHKVKRGGGAVGICAWLTAVPVPFAIDQVGRFVTPVLNSRHRTFASIMVGVEVS